MTPMTRLTHTLHERLWNTPLQTMTSPYKAIEKIPISIGLLQRICVAFLYMQEHKGECPDETLMEDLDRELAAADYKP